MDKYQPEPVDLLLFPDVLLILAFSFPPFR
jgi:hypothetical protein